MSIQQILGRGTFSPELPVYVSTPTFSNATIDATGEKVAFLGRVWNKDHTSKAIRRIGFRFGTTITKVGGSALTVSLQDVSLTANPPQPDEIQDQTVAIANADANFVATNWITTGNLSADRTVAFGELLAVVFEFDGAGRLGSDVVNIAITTGISTPSGPAIPCSTKTGGVWTGISSVLPNVILEFSDGTFGTLDYGFPMTLGTAHVYKQDTTVADEYANQFNLPFPFDVDGFWLQVSPTAATSDFDVVLYQGTTVLASVSCDAHTLQAASRLMVLPFPDKYSLSANTDYFLGIKPTQTTSTISVYSFNVNDAGHMTCHDLGAGCLYTTRLNEGAWAAATTTRRLACGLRICGCSDGGSGGGGRLVLPL